MEAKIFFILLLTFSFSHDIPFKHDQYSRKEVENRLAKQQAVLCRGFGRRETGRSGRSNVAFNRIDRYCLSDTEFTADRRDDMA